MKISLEHPAVSQCYVWQELLTDCSTIGRFCGRLDRFAKKIQQTTPEQPSPYYQFSRNESNKDEPWAEVCKKASNLFKGDVFEIFSELLIRLSPIDDRIGIYDYHVVKEDDTGVDGHGRGKNGHPVTVQIKYRLWDKVLNEIESHLHNFSLTSRNVFGVDTTQHGTMLLITTGQELHWKTIAKFSGAMKCISRGASYGCLKGAPRKTVDSLFSLKTIVDDNIFFWGLFRQQTGVDN